MHRLTALWMARLETKACKHISLTRVAERTVADQHFALQLLQLGHQPGLVEVGNIVPQPIISLTVQPRNDWGGPLGFGKTMRTTALAHVDMIVRQLALLRHLPELDEGLGRPHWDLGDTSQCPGQAAPSPIP